MSESHNQLTPCASNATKDRCCVDLCSRDFDPHLHSCAGAVEAAVLQNENCMSEAGPFPFTDEVAARLIYVLKGMLTFVEVATQGKVEKTSRNTRQEINQVVCLGRALT